MNEKWKPVEGSMGKVRHRLTLQLRTTLIRSFSLLDISEGSFSVNSPDKMNMKVRLIKHQIN